MRAFVRTASILVCIFVPAMVAGRGWWFIESTFGAVSEPFELMGLLVSTAVLLYWFTALRSHEDGRTERLVARIVVGALVLHYAYVFVSYPAVSPDYRCYDAAARQIVAGADPYDGTGYLYPPLLAQILAWLDGAVLASPLFSDQTPSSWWTVFYFYQALQLFLLLIVGERCFAFGRRVGIPVVYLAFLTAALLVVSEPMFRTLRFNQVNLVVLVAILYSLTHLRERPWSCGILMAVSVFLKPQGALFPLLWLLIGHRRAALAFVVASGALVFVQADFGRDWTLWGHFVASIDRFPQYNAHFRNQSLFSFFSNLTRAFGFELRDPGLMWFVRACTVLILGWFAHRHVDRERRFRSGLPDVPEQERAVYSLLTRTGAHTVDVILLALLLSPLVWEHHFVIASPVVLWLFAATKGRMPGLALLGLVLIFVPSTFDVWPLSYHRLAGLLLLSVTLSPRRLQQLVSDARDRGYVGADALAAALGSSRRTAGS